MNGQYVIDVNMYVKLNWYANCFLQADNQSSSIEPGAQYVYRMGEIPWWNEVCSILTLLTQKTLFVDRLEKLRTGFFSLDV